ncbi:MAG: ribosome-associated translation inhibitor RaiA [Clostridiales bacterium]|nr:ribosome-associated translation inhibitor RaiA [Clostridiales bacterium]
MKININGRKISLRPSFVEKTEKKLAKLDKFFEDSAHADVTVSPEGNQWKMEITIRHSGMVFRAEEVAHELEEALDKLVDKLVRQIRKNKTRLEKRLRAGAFIGEPAPETGTAAEEPAYRVVRSKSFPVKPLDVEEAILQMNLTGHQFYMFRNMDSGEINVVYRRHNGDYGLLEPDAD